MKIRTGFVSNSSSECFILDRRNPQVKKLVAHIRADYPDELGRGTAMAVGEDAVRFAHEHQEACGKEYSTGLGEFILKFAEELGEDNVIFLRESDEGMCGWLFGELERCWKGQDCKGCSIAKPSECEDKKIKDRYEQLEKLTLGCMEYH